MKIHDYAFTPDVSPEAQEKVASCQESLTKGSTSVGNFYVIGRGGDVLDHRGGGCHKMISMTTVSNRELVVTEGTGWRRAGAYYTSHSPQAGKTEEVVRPYAEYLCEVSPFSRFVLSGTDESLNKGFVVSADVPAPWLQNIMISTRHFLEVSRESFVRFNDLVRGGLNQDLAYLLCFNTDLTYLEKDRVLTSPVNSYSGHRVFGLLELDSARRFLGGELGRFGREIAEMETYRVDRSYTRGRLTFDDKYRGISPVNGTDATLIDDLHQDEAFRDALSHHRKKGQGEMYRPPNPFDRKATKPPLLGQVTYKELFDFVVPYLHETLSLGVEDADATRAKAA